MRKSFVRGAFILMAAGLVARLIGFAYRIFLSNLIGAEGMGLYELIVPVYTAVVLTITAGMTIAVSKMVAEQNARNNQANSGRITVCALALVVAAGIAVSLFIYINADTMSLRVLGDERTHNALLVLVPCLPAVVAASALKGYFYGIQQVVPTAVSQIAEQAVKIGVLLLFAAAISGKGAEFACTVATLAAALGEVANLLILLAVFSFKQKPSIKVRRPGKPMRRRSIVTELLKASVPVSANRLVISSLSAVEFIMIPSMLVLGGMDDKSSMELFGRLTGMALPLIMFPSLVTNSLATTLVPAISESISLKRFRTVNYQISKSIQVTFLLGIMFTALFLSFPDEIGALVYRREKIGDLLFMLAFACIFIYLQQMLTGVMNGLGKQGTLLVNTIVGSVIRIAVAYFFIPVLGIRSYIFGLTASLILTETLNLIAINRITGLIFDLREWLIKPGLVGAAMVLLGNLIKRFSGALHAEGTATTFLTLLVFGLAALVLMLVTGILRPKELWELAGMKKEEKA